MSCFVGWTFLFSRENVNSRVLLEGRLMADINDNRRILVSMSESLLCVSSKS